MKLPRRRFLQLTAAAAALPAMSRFVWAQAYPSRPVRVVVAYPPGGGTDTFTRLLCQSLSERLGQSFFVENRGGAASNIGTEAVARAPADGYTLLGTDGAAATNATLYDNLNFNFVRDFTIIGMSRAPLVLVAHPTLPAKTMAEFIAYAKTNPGKITMASAGSGHPSHLAGVLLKKVSGVDMTHVPYRGGGPAISDLLGGQVQVLFSGFAQAVEHVRSGKLRALAVTTDTPSPALPDIPTVGEIVPGYEMSQWYAVGIRKGTPSEIVDKLNNQVNAALTDPKLTAKLADFGNAAFLGSPAVLSKFVAEDTEKWATLIRAANIKPE
jgi:tripartite-type tricarboxylate transporter receptor subunit TctC